MTINSNAQPIALANSAAFDRQLARLLLEICRYTYSASFPDDINEKKDADDALAWINKVSKPLKIILLNDGKGAKSTSVACVFSYPDKNIVSYMGTKTEFSNIQSAVQSIADWDRNVQFKPVSFGMTKRQLGLGDSNETVTLEGRVHDGFLKELKAIQEQVIATLMTLGGKTKNLYITGHSQGGAEAALATRAFLAGGFNVKATYTFAAPRSSNRAVADSISKNIPIHRIEFGNDIVPHVPTTHALHALDHVTQKVIDDLSKLGWHPQLIERLDEEHHIVGIGRLCYGNNATKILRVDISAEDEDKLLNDRLKDLIKHPTEWAEHHHLAGKKGNYTALVSDFTYRVG